MALRKGGKSIKQTKTKMHVLVNERGCWVLRL